MNRRELLSTGGQLVIGSVVFGSAAYGGTRRPIEIKTPNARPSLGPEAKCDLCPMTEAFARQLMAETGDWKQGLWDDRKGAIPIVLTRHGCCCCEITLESGKRDPDWSYRLRPMTTEETKTFHEEYGQTAPLLTCMDIPGSPTLEVRGFVLNGRTLGWNLSVREKNG